MWCFAYYTLPLLSYYLFRKWYYGNMLVKVLTISTFGSLLALLVLLRNTSPSTIHPSGILLVFFLIYLLALGLLTFLIFQIGRFVKKVQRTSTDSLSIKKAYYFASVIALAPVVFIGMSSIGRTSIYDISLVVLFEIVACLYVAKRQ